jgi:hypothetical protein
MRQTAEERGKGGNREMLFPDKRVIIPCSVMRPEYIEVKGNLLRFSVIGNSVGGFWRQI